MPYRVRSGSPAGPSVMHIGYTVLQAARCGLQSAGEVGEAQRTVLLLGRAFVLWYVHIITYTSTQRVMVIFFRQTYLVILITM